MSAAVEPVAGRTAGIGRDAAAPPAARRWMWAVLVAGLVLLPLLSLPGRYVGDTRDALWFAPGSYLTHSLHVWQSSPFLGSEQRDGLLVPMAAIVALLRGAGLSIWVTERLWHGLLLFVAAAGVVLLVDALRDRRDVVAPAVAGLVYALSPYALVYGLGTTGAFLPYVLLPWLLLATVRGVGSRSLAAPVMFALVTFLMGGGNGAPQVYAFVPVAGYVLWVTFVERSVSARDAGWFVAWALVFFVGLNAYWIVAFTSSNVGNALAFSETPKVISATSSFSEAIRGLGFWVYYGGDQFGAWAPTAHRYIASPLFILEGFAVPVVALLSAWLVRWRFRLLFVFLLAVSVVVMVGAFPIAHPSPFGRVLLWAYGHVPGVGGLRTTYKGAGTVLLSLGVLAGVGVERAWQRARTAPRAPVLRPLVVAAAVAALVVPSLPLVTGALYGPARSAGALPAYWEQALGWLRRNEHGTRAFFAPAMTAGTYRWGTLHEGVPEAFPWLSAAHPVRVPFGQHYGSNLLSAIEDPYRRDVTPVDEAAMLRLIGADRVVVQNDVDWQRGHTARPAAMQVLKRDETLRPGVAFGVAGEDVVARSGVGASDAQARTERSLPPLQTLTVARPLPFVRAQAGNPVVVSGDGFGLAAMARAGMLDADAPLRYSGAETPTTLAALASAHPSFVVTDSNRRRVWSFAGVQNNQSYTLAADQTLGEPSAVAYGLFGGRLDTQTVAVDQGVRSITASGYGSAFTSAPQYRPENAFDGDPNTWWLVGGFGNPVGAWVQVAFDAARRVSQATIQDLGFPAGRTVQRVRLEFSDGTSVVSGVHSGRNVVRFPARSTRFLRIRILNVSQSALANAVGFADVSVPGVSVREVLRVPDDLSTAAVASPAVARLVASSPLAYVFQRERTDAPLGRDEETTMDRLFSAPDTRSFAVSGTIRLNRSATDPQIDAVVSGPSDVQATSTGRLLGGFAVRASAAIDGDPSTAWVPPGSLGESLRITFPERTLTRFSIQTQRVLGRTFINQLTVAFSNGRHAVARVGADGVAHVKVPPTKTTFVVLTVTDTIPAPNGTSPPIGISEVSIPGVRLPRPDPSRALGCRATDSLSIDGIPLDVRVGGTVGDLLAGRAAPFTECGHGAVTLGSGQHELLAEGALEPDALTLRSGADGSPAESTPGSAVAAPRTTVTQTATGGFRVAVHDSTAPFYLTIGQNYSPSWRASIRGKGLGVPVLLDGYSAGWRVARTGSFVIDVRYAPQRTFEIALGLSALTLLAAVAIAWRERRRCRTRRADVRADGGP